MYRLEYPSNHVPEQGRLSENVSYTDCNQPDI